MNYNQARLIALWQESFGDSRQWIEKYFRYVLNPEFNISLSHGDKLCSSLFLVPYKMNLYGKELSCSYVSGACTDIRMRHNGYMSQLMKRALDKSFNQGDDFMVLIPANRSLYGYYDHFNFATVFYVNRQHYTSLHNFHGEGLNIRTENLNEDKIWEYFSTKEKEMSGRILHSRKDLHNILWDVEDDSGKIIAVEKNGEISGISFVVPEENAVIVKEIMADNDSAEKDLLTYITGDYPGKDIIIEARVGNSDHIMEAKGMLRIVNVRKVLESIAETYPDISQVIKITDNILKENNNIFRIHRGKVEIVTDSRLETDNEMDIKTLAEVLFSSSATGKLFGLPSFRPSMSLMME